MQLICERCCGLDVHSRTVVACLRTPGADRTRHPAVRTFGTTTPELLRLADWLLEAGCTHVAMESTGVYWKPVFHLLESVCEVLLVNAAPIKQVPGRKTDVKDSEGIAQLLEVGLLRPSFIPPRPIRELRDLTRYRKTLVQQRASEVNRVHQRLEDANIKLGQVATDVLGASGRKMLSALIAGERDGEKRAQLALGTLRKKAAQRGPALTGRFTDHHAWLLRQVLTHIDELSRHLGECDTPIEEYLRPFAGEKGERLQTIPGVSVRAAEVILAEVGTDMSRFPSAGPLASWAGRCPGNDESAGKRRSGKTRQGDPWLRAILVEAAWAAARTKGTYLASLYARLARRRGAKKAAIAVGHRILVAVWHILKNNVAYDELGANYLDQRDTERLTHYYLRRLEELGVPVTIAEVPQAA